jgi:histidyl-tRNA synthetase
LGAQSAVAGGGRYDGLVKELGGPQIPATGFAIGFDRLAEISALKPSDYERKPDIFVAALGEKSQSLAFEWICRLGLDGIGAEMDFSGKSLKSQMKRADRLGASYVLILGDKELEVGTATLRNMATKAQVSLPIDGIVEKIKRTIR